MVQAEAAEASGVVFGRLVKAENNRAVLSDDELQRIRKVYIAQISANLTNVMPDLFEQQALTGTNGRGDQALTITVPHSKGRRRA